MEHPNVVLILCDDLGWGDLPCYGHQSVRAHGGWVVRGELKTPNLDRMAQQGTRFTQFYAASAVCSPSRAALMTGQFPARLGIHDYLSDPELNVARGVADYLDPAVPTVARLLQCQGYATAHFGKWHLGSGPKAPGLEAYGFEQHDPCIGAKPNDAHSSQRVADQTVSFIETNRHRPFFINVWLYDPHSPLHPTDEIMAPYQNLAPGWGEHKGSLQVYYGVLTEIDRQVGRILDKLDSLGLSENTIVIFSSDHGPESGLLPFTSHYGSAASVGPFRGLKRSLYEGGVRAPFIVRWPGRTPAGAVDDQTTAAGIDFLPTVCQVTGTSLPPGIALDGEDLSDAFQGRPQMRSTPLFWENRFPVYGHVLDMSPMLAIRDGDWKLLMNPDRGRVELYDIPGDASEINNAAERLPEIVQHLSERLLAWQADLPKGPVDPRAGRNDYPWPRPL